MKLSIRVYADESKTAVLERITTSTRAEFISAANALKKKYGNQNLGVIPAWVQQGSQIFSNISLSNIIETARIMQRKA